MWRLYTFKYVFRSFVAYGTVTLDHLRTQSQDCESTESSTSVTLALVYLFTKNNSRQYKIDEMYMKTFRSYHRN